MTRSWPVCPDMLCPVIGGPVANNERELAWRQPEEHDHVRLLEGVSQWWGDAPDGAAARARSALIPRLFLQHFNNTSLLLEDGPNLVGFLIGFLSPSRASEAYIHFVAINPAYQRRGLDAELYQRFFSLARHNDRVTIRCITSPVLQSLFHAECLIAVYRVRAGSRLA